MNEARAEMSGTAELIEVFSAIQGEGPIVGRRQIFVRFGRCDVHCAYCDTPLCHVELERARVETLAGSRVFESWPNPVPLDYLADAIERLRSGPARHHSVSFTGGEPLLHPQAIVALAPAIRAAGLLVYLETNGHLVDALLQVIDGVDIIGMDVKIASTTGFAADHAANRAFLAAARDAARETFVKVVVGDATTDAEIEAAAAVVADVAPATPFIIQPVTPFRGQGTPPSPSRILALQDAAAQVVADVRVIPQTHKMIHQL